jgi:phospholipid/cholesterol/gamma-HCH transport system permease protein
VPVQIIHQRFRAFTTQLGEIFQLLVEALRSLRQQRPSWRDFLYQLQFIGVKSQSVVITTGAATGMVLCAQTFLQFHKVKMDTATGAVVSIGMSSELGPVLAALMLTGRVGAAMTAELGTMKVTEQIDALRMLGIEPVRYIVIPRFVACVLGAAALTIIANIVCLICAALVSEAYLGFTFGLFRTAMSRFVDFQDLLFATIKGAVFGSVIPLVSCFFGFRCKSGAEGVGLATTQSVVTSSVAIIVLDFILTYVFSHFY